MALHAGTRLGQYQITSLMGAGGMGEVYSARDSRLAREVAIKVIREGLDSEERLARVEREARLLASLNHPGIAILYGMEEWQGSHFLVMELVEGETLAERIRRGPIPVAESLSLFWQITQALEAAHKKKIIHRDLKPANIKITPEGRSKVLDFGLATAFVSDFRNGVPTESPTITREELAKNGLLGTVAYMSPEQARRKSLDQRTDIWSFGCCLYEALTGAPAYWGETVSDTIAAILRDGPDWKKLPADTPAAIRGLLDRCLERDLSRRMDDMADARLEIEKALGPVGFAPLAATVREGIPAPVSGGPGTTRPPRSCTLTLGIAFTALAGIGTAVYMFRSNQSHSSVAVAPTASVPPELANTDLARLQRDADEVFSQIAVQKNVDAAPSDPGWRQAESMEALGLQAYEAEDYETALRRWRTALELYKDAGAATASPNRELRSAGNPQREALLAVLADYEKALETKDLALFRSVKPNLSAVEEKRLRDAFESTDRQEVELQVDAIDIRGDDATASVTRIDRITVRGVLQETSGRKQTFRFRRSDSKWLIVEIGP
jgi:tetratricopeptide (TPR) repeat protein